jgi:homoserine O-succinyltransferase
MPIILPNHLPSAALLRREAIEVLPRPSGHGPVLRVGLLNLMPDMTRTEMQFGRLLGATRHQVELVLAIPQSYRRGHLATEQYSRWDELSLPDRLDGLIVTGAPLEHLPFEDVRYWRELTDILDWAAGNVGSTLYVCWGAFAALYRFHGVRTRVLPHKISGVYDQHIVEACDPLVAGLGTTFPCPVSRLAEIDTRDMPWRRGLTCLAQSFESGVCLVADPARNAHYIFNHIEYDADTLKLEYLRDSSQRAATALPQNYLPSDDLSQEPPLRWRAAAEQLFSNWLAQIAAKRRAPVNMGRSAA